MHKFLNIKISSVPAIAIIAILAAFCGLFAYWQCSKLKPDQLSFTAIEIFQDKTSNENMKAGYVPGQFLGSDEKILEYLAGLYCGISRGDISGEGIYMKKLAKDQPDFFISTCSVASGCSKGTVMTVYYVDRKSGLMKTVWWSNIYILAKGSSLQYASAENTTGSSETIVYMKSDVNFEDLNNDGTLEIIQDIIEMTCLSKCDKSTGCCSEADYCVGNKIISKEEYQKRFEWSGSKKLFLPVY